MVCKVASGAAETVPFVQVTNLVRTLRHLQDAHRVFVVGTAGEADIELFQADLTGPLALVMGAEGEGMRRLTRETCDQLVRLPMPGRSRASTSRWRPEFAFTRRCVSGAAQSCR